MVFRFTIDKVLNPYIPANKLLSLPRGIRFFLGKHSVRQYADYWIWLEILISSFCGIALLEGVFRSHTVFTNHHALEIIASYGATAILCFNAIQAPLAQPRNILVGHFISSLIGICIQKLFSLSQGGQDNYWASGALSVGIASVAMSICNCVHPPAGASALLPSISEQIRQMSWWYLPVHLVSSVLIICVALITGNILQTYPVYWWTSAPVGSSLNPEPQPKPQPQQDPESLIALQPVVTDHESRLSLQTAVTTKGITYNEEVTFMQIDGDEIIVPEGISLTELEIEWLNSLQMRLRQFADKP